MSPIFGSSQHKGRLSKYSYSHQKVDGRWTDRFNGQNKIQKNWKQRYLAQIYWASTFVRIAA